MTRLRSLLSAVLDPDRLADMTGRPVRASSLRIKPQTSVVIGLDDAVTGRADGWARLLWPDVHVKAEKAARRADRRGQRLTTRSLSHDLLLQVGEIAADPALSGPLRRASAAGLPHPSTTDVLRHNPLRRLVMRAGDVTCRVTAAADTLAWPLDRALFAARVPVPGRVDDGEDPRVAVQPFVGDTDLLHAPDRAATREAGRALAQLHAAAASLPADMLAALRARRPGMSAQGEAHVRLLSALAPDLAARLRELRDRVAARCAGHSTTVLAHGDFSPDQVLIDRASGRIWITDLDRACLAAPATDLGSYLAVAADADLGAALLAGYREGGCRPPGCTELDAAVARALLFRVADPIRRARPDWHDQVTLGIDRLEGILG